MPRYLYSMRHLRGFGPGCQPGKGLIGREDDPAGRYNDVLVYDRELEPHEIDDYELDFMRVEPDTTADGSNVVKKGGNDEDRTSGDCISRAQAIDALKEKVFRNLTDEFYGAMQVLDELPSVKPETNCSEIPNSSDVISRQAAIDAICTEGTRLERNGTVAMVEIKQWCVDILEALPPAQPERKTGRWLPDNTDYYRTKFICSVCGESEEVPTTGFGYGTMWGYCPNCGAKMERRQDGH